MIRKRKRTAIRSVTWTTREWRELSLSVVVAFGAAIVGAAINFGQRIDSFFRPHANQPFVQFVIQFLVVWLIALLGISYLKWRKATLKSAELEDIVDSISPDVFLVVDPQRNILMTSVSVRRMFGHDPEEVLQKKTDLLYADRRCMPNVKNEVHDALEQDGFHVGWATGRRKDGRTFPLEIITGILKQHGGSVLVLRDITERKHAEQLLRDREVQLHQAQKMESVGRLAGGVAHEFNNRLMGIMNYAEFCRDKIAPDHPIREWLNEITLEAERSAKLAHQLLAFARKQTIAPQRLDLNETVAGMLTLLRNVLGAEINLAWLPGAGLGLVQLDPSQVNQILINLFTNAHDAIAGVGKVTVATANVTLDQAYCDGHDGAVPGEHVLLAVSDTGCGMDRETVNKLFEPFFTTKTFGTGAGLGLASVYGIVRQNNGYIDVSSEPGKGTTFKIYIPRFVGKVDKPTVASVDETPRGRGETILFVEDEPALLTTYGRCLVSLGYEVLLAENPTKALDLVARHSGDIHLLFTDVIMPGMNGRELAEQLQASKPGLKVLFMSGYTADVIAKKGCREESVNFIQKPFSRDALARKVREVLDV